jgi:hypothetical protein
MMKQIIHIWMQPIYGRLNLGDRKTLIALFLIFPFLGFVFALAISNQWIPDRNAWGVNAFPILMFYAAMIGVALYAIAWFIMLVTNIVLQFSPANANLVPNLKSVMRNAICIPIFAIPGILCLGFSYLIADKLLVVWCLLSIAMLLIALSIRIWWLVFLAAGVSQLPLVFKSTDVMSVLSEHRFFFVIVVCSLVWFGVHWILGLQGDSLFIRHERNQRFRKALSAPEHVAVTTQFALSFNWFYYWKLNRLLSKANNKRSYFPVVLGPSLNWVNLTMQVFFLGAIISLCFLIIAYFDGKSISPSSDSLSSTASAIEETINFDRWLPLVFFSLAFIGMLFLAPYMFLQEVFRTRKEQALLALVPTGLPYSQYSKCFLTYLLKQFFCLWAFCFAIAILVIGTQTLHPRLIDAILLALFSALPMSLSLLKNHAKTSGLGDHALGRIALLCVVLFSISFVLQWHWANLPVLFLCLLIAAATFSGGVHAWRKLKFQEAIFPAGRSV